MQGVPHEEMPSKSLDKGHGGHKRTTVAYTPSSRYSSAGFFHSTTVVRRHVSCPFLNEDKHVAPAQDSSLTGATSSRINTNTIGYPLHPPRSYSPYFSPTHGRRSHPAATTTTAAPRVVGSSVSGSPIRRRLCFPAVPCRWDGHPYERTGTPGGCSPANRTMCVGAHGGRGAGAYPLFVLPLYLTRASYRGTVQRTNSLHSIVR